MDNIIMSDSDEIDQYTAVAAALLSRIFNVTEFMITDDSTLADFAMCCLPDGYPYDEMTYDDVSQQADEYMTDKIYDAYGIITSPTMTIVEVCRLICKPAPTIH